MDIIELFAFALTILGGLGISIHIVFVRLPIYVLFLSSCFVALGYLCTWKMYKNHKLKEQTLKC